MATLIQTLDSQSHWIPAGTQTIFPITFSGPAGRTYLDPAHVKAKLVNSVTKVETPINTGVSFVSQFQLQILPAPANTGNTVLVIYRDTPRALPLVDYQNTTLDERSLDLSALQEIFLLQETNDRVTVAIQGGPSASLAGVFRSDGSTAMTGNINANTNRVTNLGTPVAATDAATRAYADTKLALTGGTVTGKIVSNFLPISSVVRNAAGTVATGTAFTFDGILAAQGSNYNTANGVFTCPETGFYEISWVVRGTTTAGSIPVVAVNVNGTDLLFSRGSESPAGTFTFVGSTILNAPTVGTQYSLRLAGGVPLALSVGDGNCRATFKCLNITS